VLVKEATPTLSMMFGEEIEGKLGVRELQTAFVHSLVLGKKARVSGLSCCTQGLFNAARARLKSGTDS